MIESMGTAVARNILADMAGNAATVEATWNAICLADMGDTGVAFVALPQIPPRNVTWTKVGRWVHVAKIAFEKYFLKIGEHTSALQSLMRISYAVFCSTKKNAITNTQHYAQ